MDNLSLHRTTLIYINTLQADLHSKQKKKKKKKRSYVNVELGPRILYKQKIC